MPLEEGYYWVWGGDGEPTVAHLDGDLRCWTYVGNDTTYDDDTPEIIVKIDLPPSEVLRAARNRRSA